jgi:general secretion pathway protein A
MYLSYYNLTSKPFQISTDPKFLWLGEKHKEALAVLKYGIMDNRGFLLLTGDVGTGKTTLINALINSLGNKIVVAMVPDPDLEKIEFFNFIATAFKFNKTFDQKSEFLVRLTRFLNAAYAKNKKTLLIIDEAQRLNYELLEEIRLLSNIEKQHAKLINIFLVGQDELNGTLLEKKNRALRQRITINYNIEPLTEEETKEYIQHRLKVAGSEKNLFNSGAMREIYLFSDGYPRLINIICDHGLLAGYVKEKKNIDAKIIRECAEELKIPAQAEKTVEVKKSPTPTSYLSPNTVKKIAIYTMVLLLFLIVAGYFYYPIGYNHYSANMKHFLNQVSKRYNRIKPIDATQRTLEEKPNPAHNDLNYPIENIQQKENLTIKADAFPINDAEKSVDTGLTSPKNNPAPIVNEEEKKIVQTYSANQKELQSLSNQDFVIYYDYNSSELSEEAFNLLDRLVETIQNNLEIKIDIRGYTDRSGRYLYNKKLSESRASNVRSYLLGKGVDPQKIASVGLGPESSILDDDSKSRRVEIKLYD